MCAGNCTSADDSVDSAAVDTTVGVPMAFGTADSVGAGSVGAVDDDAADGCSGSVDNSTI